MHFDGVNSDDHDDDDDDDDVDDVCLQHQIALHCAAVAAVRLNNVESYF